MDYSLMGYAFAWGILSAVSLPIGALIGLKWRPSRVWTSALMSFGAGALLFALTIELFGSSLKHAEGHGSSVVVVTALAAIAGGVLFHVANKILNDRGAFVRNFSNTKKWLIAIKRKMSRGIIGDLSENRVLRVLPPEKVGQLVPFLHRHKFSRGMEIFNEGDQGDRLYLIRTGVVEVLKSTAAGETQTVATLSDNDVFGEMALVTGEPRVASAVAQEETVAFSLSREDLLELADTSPQLKQSLTAIAQERRQDLEARDFDVLSEEEWEQRALNAFQRANLLLSEAEIREESQRALAKPQAGTAIWLGLLIDGLPESLVIGLLAKQPGGMSLAFIAGVFLSNFPESLSGAASMSDGGMKKKKVLLMWSSLCLMMGLGAALGIVLFPNSIEESLLSVAAIEGMAAGAMLTAIAESFLPEAYEQGGDIIGLTTLAGFLSALMIKLV